MQLRDSIGTNVVKWLLLAGLIVALVAPAVSGAPDAPTLSAAVTRSPSAPSPVALERASARAAKVEPTPAPITEQQQVISFLGGAIAWYRQLNLEYGLIEEPSEALYLTADVAMADEVIKLAFDYAQAEANLLAKFASAAQQPGAAPDHGSQAAALESRLTQVKDQMKATQAQVKDLTAGLKAARRAQKDAVARQLLAAQSELELESARADFLTTMGEFERGSGPASPASSLQAQIDELQRSMQPEAKPKPQASVEAQSSEPNGIIGLSEHLFELRGKVATIDQRVDATAAFAKSVSATHAPLAKNLQEIDKNAEQLTQLALGDDRTTIEQRKMDFEQLIKRRKLLSAALLPLTKQQVVLRRYADNLGQWRKQVLRHTTDVLHALLLHLAGFLLLVGLIAALAIIWRMLAVRYVEDANRRRQIMKVRDVTVVILVGLILLFNFTTELGALATVVGFAAAGIAIALQDVILSIAGYFRLSGRFGIKHGDRVEVQGVRGEVVEIGLLKLTLLELGGDAFQSGPTGRLVMIPNSSVFREKFLNHPAHSLMVWRELHFTLAPDCDFRVVEKRLLEIVEAVFARYRDNAQTQLLTMERLLNIRIDSGRPQSRVRLGPSGLQITLRYPVDVRSEAQLADEISRRLLDFLAREPGLRFVPTGAPNIQSVAIVAEPAEANGAEAKVEESPAAPGLSPGRQA